MQSASRKMTIDEPVAAARSAPAFRAVASRSPCGPGGTAITSSAASSGGRSSPTQTTRERESRRLRTESSCRRRCASRGVEHTVTTVTSAVTAVPRRRRRGSRSRLVRRRRRSSIASSRVRVLEPGGASGHAAGSGQLGSTIGRPARPTAEAVSICSPNGRACGITTARAPAAARSAMEFWPAQETTTSAPATAGHGSATQCDEVVVLPRRMRSRACSTSPPARRDGRHRPRRPLRQHRPLRPAPVLRTSPSGGVLRPSNG